MLAKAFPEAFQKMVTLQKMKLPSQTWPHFFHNQTDWGGKKVGGGEMGADGPERSRESRRRVKSQALVTRSDALVPNSLLLLLVRHLLLVAWHYASETAGTSWNEAHVWQSPPDIGRDDCSALRGIVAACRGQPPPLLPTLEDGLIVDFLQGRTSHQGEKVLKDVESCKEKDPKYSQLVLDFRPMSAKVFTN